MAVRLRLWRTWMRPPCQLVLLRLLLSPPTRQLSFTASPHYYGFCYFSVAAKDVLSLARTSFTYRPIGLFTLPCSFAIALLLVNLVSIGRNLAQPSRISPFRLVSMPDDGSRERVALIGGRKLWAWGALIFAALSSAQLFLSLKYGRLAAGLLSPRICGDIAFITLWTTAFVHVITSHHSIPLLRRTATYDPPPVLARPLCRPFPTTAILVVIPLLVLASLASAAIAGASTVSVLHSAIHKSSQLFANASQPGSAAAYSTDGDAGNNRSTPVMGPDEYTVLQAELTDAWKGTLRGMESGVKGAAVLVLLIALIAVETKVYLRYWQLSKNAKREERLTRRANKLEFGRTSKVHLRPSSRQTGHVEDAFVPTLPFGAPPAASLPMCRSFSRSSAGSSSSGSSSSSAFTYPVPHSEEYYPHKTHLLSATPYAPFPFSAEPLHRTSSAESALSSHPPYHTPTSASNSTHLPYYQTPSLHRSGSYDSSFTVYSDGLPALAYLQHGSPESCSSPRSALHDRAYHSQARALEKCQLQRPDPAARRMGREGSWDGERSWDGSDKAAAAYFGLGSPEARKSWDTLPVYASRTGSRATRRPEGLKPPSWRGEEEGMNRRSEGMSARSYSNSSAGSFTSQDELLMADLDEVSYDLIAHTRRGGYAGPSSSCFKAMRSARVADALWSTGSLVAFAVLYTVKAAWASDIANLPGLAFFVLIIEHMLPLFACFVIHATSYCREVSSRGDANLFAQTRWGRGLNDDGWWIPSDEAEKELRVEEEQARQEKRSWG
ncbi:hypothetical protein JCM21900_005723 [Sporobolomyces salmonicolor]